MPKLCHSIFIMLYQNILEYTVHNNLNLFNLFLRKSRGGAAKTISASQPPHTTTPPTMLLHFISGLLNSIYSYIINLEQIYMQVKQTFESIENKQRPR